MTWDTKLFDYTPEEVAANWQAAEEVAHRLPAALATMIVASTAKRHFLAAGALGFAAGTGLQIITRGMAAYHRGDDLTLLNTWLPILETSALDSARTLMCLGIGSVGTKLGTKYISNALWRRFVVGVGVNETVGFSYSGLDLLLYGKTDFAWSDAVIWGGSGILGGFIHPKNPLLEFGSEYLREVAEEVTQTYVKHKKITTAEVIMATGMAMQEGGSKGAHVIYRAAHSLRGYPKGEFNSEQNKREGEAPVALPLEGATQAPIIDADFVSLEETAALVATAKRVAADPSATGFRVADILPCLSSPEGQRRLREQLEKRGVSVRPVSFEADVFQTDDASRSIVELTSNAYDASSSDVSVTVEDGHYSVTDEGIGMDEADIYQNLFVPKLSGKPDPKGQIGRFGIGFLTSLRHLETEQDFVEVVTQKEGKTPYHIVIRKKDGRYEVLKKVVNDDEARRFLPGRHGTYTRVQSSSIQKNIFEAELTHYFRLAPGERRICLNGSQVNTVTVTNTRQAPYNSLGVATLGFNPDGPRQLSVCVGPLVVETYPLEGNVPEGEVVLRLPQATPISITRDKVVVTEEAKKLVESSNIVGHVSDDLPLINALAPLMEAWDRRTPGLRLTEALSGIATSQITVAKRVYPDRKPFRSALQPGPEVVFIHPLLYQANYDERFDSPAEFVSGEVFTQSDTKPPLKLVISPDLKGGLVFDAERGVVYLSQAAYESKSPVELAALFMIKGLDFCVTWHTQLERAALAAVTPVAAMAGDAPLATSLRRLQEVGLDLVETFIGSPIESIAFNVNTTLIPVPSPSSPWCFLYDNQFQLTDRFGNKILGPHYSHTYEQKNTIIAKFNKSSLRGVQQDMAHLRDLRQRGAIPQEIPFYFVMIDGTTYTLLDEKGKTLTILTDVDNGVYTERFYQGELYAIYTNTATQETELVPFNSAVPKISFTEQVYITVVGDEINWIPRKDYKEHYYSIKTLEGEEKFSLPNSLEGFSVISDIWSLPPYTVVVRSRPHEGQKQKCLVDNKGKILLETTDNNIFPFVHNGQLMAVSTMFKEGRRYCTLHHISEGRATSLGGDVSIFDWEGVTYLVVNQEGRYQVLEGNGQFLYQGSGQLAANYYDQKLNNRSNYFDTGFLEELLARPALAERIAQLRENHLSVPSHLNALVGVDDATWQRFMGNAELRPLLAQLGHPACLAWAEAHPRDNASDLRPALEVGRVLAQRIFPTDYPLFCEKLKVILREVDNITELLEDLRAGRESILVNAAIDFLSQEGATFLIPQTPQIVLGSGVPAQNLADAITHLRLYPKMNVADLGKTVPSYQSEMEVRELRHAAGLYRASHPHVYLREFLQNSLDAMAGIAEEQREVRIDTAMHDNKLLVRFFDAAGMSEAQVKALIDPGLSLKQEGIANLGGFGVGFYSSLAGAQWVRVRTALPGSSTVYDIEFVPHRNGGGEIVNVDLKIVKLANTANYHGTMIESLRLGAPASWQGSLLTAMAGDLCPNINPSRASIYFNGEFSNQNNRGALVVADTVQLGKVELYDSLHSRLLLGGLPLCDMAKELRASVPPVVLAYFDRLGFAINLEHTRHKPTPTRDRLRNQNQVEQELANILPGMLVAGFLKRASQPEYREDIRCLPDVYFNDAYGMVEKIPERIKQDGQALAKGRFEACDADFYDTEDKLVMLLGTVPFIRVTFEGTEQLLSLCDVHAVYQASLTRNPSEVAWLAAILNSGDLPKTVKTRLIMTSLMGALWDTRNPITELDEAIASGNTHPLNGPLEKEKHYSLDDVADSETKYFLEKSREILEEILHRYRPDEKVEVGIHTVTEDNWLRAYAFHFDHGQEYHFHRSWGANFFNDVREYGRLVQRLAEAPDNIQAQTTMERFLAGLTEKLSHELTHYLRGEADYQGVPHGTDFLNDQRRIILGDF